MQPVDITCGNLMLRPWTEYDVESVFVACQDPEIQRWMPVPSPYTREEAVTWCTVFSPDGWERGSAASWAILDATTGALLGSIGLVSIQGGAAEIGYWCAPEARGRGVLTEAIPAVCRWAFGALGLERIGWYALSGNHPSRAVAQKCGFTFDGTERGLLTQRGGRFDGWVASLLATDEAVDTRPLPRPPVLTDGVVTLRGWTPDDAPLVAQACDDPLTAQWLPVPVPYTLEDAQAYIGGYIAEAWADGTAAELAVTDAVTGELLGAMGIKLRLRNVGVGEIGYWVAPWARGRGVAGRGAALSGRWALGELGLSRVELLADVDNVRSRSAAEKAGFVREGVARRSRRDRDGVARDMVLFSLTAEDRPS